MIKKLLLVFFVVLAFSAQAQFVTNGDGTAYDFEGLAEVTTQISIDGNNVTLSGEVTLSASDSLLLESVDTLFFAADGFLRIEGVMVSQMPDIAVFTAVDSALGHEGLTFDESVGSVLENIHFQYGGGVKLLYSDVQIKHCRFYKMTDANGSGAVEMLQSNPVIDSCEFISNMRSGVASSATAGSSPQILNSYFYGNNTENGNRPQINLGTSDGENDIIIRGNIIDGFYDEAGGMSLATLAGGSVSAIIENNTIRNNRYGINIQGSVSVDILGNHIIDNNLEDNPMAGGSGISFYSGAQAVVANNIITGNLWGITIPSAASPNFGQIEPDTVNIGHNYIYDNGNGGVIYNLYNNSASEIYAQNNYWGTTSEIEAGEGIIDNADNSSLGQVFYEPIYLLSSDKAFESFYLMIDGEPAYGEIDEIEHSIIVNVPQEYDLTALVPYFELSEYATVLVGDAVQVSGQTEHDFTNSLVYSVMAEDSTLAEYDVYVYNAISVPDLPENAFLLYPNPVQNRLYVQNVISVEQVSVIDLAGRVVVENRGGSSIDVAPLVSGVYLAVVHLDDGRTKIQKFMKE